MLTFQNHNNDNNDNPKAENNSKEEAEAEDVWCFTDDENVKNSNNPKFLTIPPATYGYCSKLGGEEILVSSTHSTCCVFFSLTRKFSFLRHLSIYPYVTMFDVI